MQAVGDEQRGPGPDTALKPPQDPLAVVESALRGTLGDDGLRAVFGDVRAAVRDGSVAEPAALVKRLEAVEDLLDAVLLTRAPG